MRMRRASKLAEDGRRFAIRIKIATALSGVNLGAGVSRQQHKLLGFSVLGRARDILRGCLARATCLGPDAFFASRSCLVVEQRFLGRVAPI